MVLKITNAPIRRPNFIVDVQFRNNNSELELEVLYQTLKNIGAITFRATQTNDPKQIFLTDSERSLIENIDRDVLVTHLRMATILSRTQVGTAEWETAIKATTFGQDKWLQTAVGPTQVLNSDLVFIDNVFVDITFRVQESPTNAVTHRVSYSELDSDFYMPQPHSAVLMVPGAVRRELGYVHDPGVDELNSEEKLDVVNFLKGMGTICLEGEL